MVPGVVKVSTGISWSLDDTEIRPVAVDPFFAFSPRYPGARGEPARSFRDGWPYRRPIAPSTMDLIALRAERRWS
jgi:hypothetical protein